ncbi:MAG: glycoside hydrolase family 2 TIM barrel-domain containing protein [Mucinivorans sp.]
MKKLSLMLILALSCIALYGNVPQAKGSHFSTAGFFQLESTGRTVHSMNPSWLFFKGNPTTGDPSAIDFDDAQWRAVNLPSGMELLPLEASGGVNYRGAAWYRKHFVMPTPLAGKRLILYFEAIMGRSKIWVNGHLATEHFGGFTPISLDVSELVNAEGNNVITVMTDNSDDPIYPPGKPQATLDFCYFGGIYRDVWLVATSKDIYVTDPNMVDKVAGGGLFASYTSVSEQSANIGLKLDVDGQVKNLRGKVEYELIAPDGTKVLNIGQTIKRGENTTSFTVSKPQLWSPASPNLYRLNVRVKNSRGEVVDGFTQRLGIRSIDFSFSRGFILNGKPYPRKLMGANRHQDFAVVGNALSNNLHFRDVAKLKSAGLEIVRNAHYPQDPAFMDACDELGMFVIVNTPGWQFWNEAAIFEQRVYADIRTMIRRDRNHASVLMWEPILNETYYPEAFAQNTHNIVKTETPYPGTNFTAADQEARGAKYFDVIFTHPFGGGSPADENGYAKKLDTTKVYYTREWGDNVDDWNSHNSPSRVARQWGEVPQMIQAKHYAAPSYPYTCYDLLQKQAPYHFGGTLWHSFDHQRGYHPDPFYGGIMDAFRRPKYSYYMFQGQTMELVAPMVYIANELTPFSPEDVTVFSNCASVRLTTFFGEDSVRMGVKKQGERWFTFPSAWNVMQDKWASRAGKQSSARIVAQGLDDQGNVIATTVRRAARRPEKLEIIVDTMSNALVADGGDLVVVTARMVDKWGNVKRLNNEYIRFTIQGEGTLMASAATVTNPAAVLWGEASVLVQSTTKAGAIKISAAVIASGDNTPISGSTTIYSVDPTVPLVYDAKVKGLAPASLIKDGDQIDREAIKAALLEVEQQQTSFGEKEKTK